MVAVAAISGYPQRKASKPAATAKTPVTELAKLRQEYIDATKTYKASLENLRTIYEQNVTKAEAHFKQSQELYHQGLISKLQLDESEREVTVATRKVDEVRKQMASADSQIAETLVEADTEAKMAKNRLARGALLRTTSYIRYNGTASWGLPQAGQIQQFFLNTFKRPLPIAVFGQGAIHDQWHLDHRNAMDISLHPDGVEGQALINYLRANGIPFSAFRGAIPGTATGPHIHIGRPSHRY